MWKGIYTLYGRTHFILRLRLIHLPSRALSNLKHPDSVRMKYAAMRGFTVNRDDTAFVACHACVNVFKIHEEKRKKREKNDAPGSPIISPRATGHTIFDPLSKFGPRSPSTFVWRVPYETIGRYLLSFHVEHCPQGGHLYVLRESFDGLAGFAVPETDTKGEPQRTRMDAPLTRVRFQWPRRD